MNKPYLIEAAWYSPTTHDIYHYAVIDVDADNSKDAFEKAVQVLRRNGKKLNMGPEPIGLKIVGAQHRWGKGYMPGSQPILREGSFPNPLSLRGKEAVLGGTLLAAILGIAYLLRSKSATAAPPVTTTASGGGTTTASSGGTTVTTTPTTAQTYQVTEANSGQTITMAVGDSLAVELTVTPPIADYTSSTSGANALTPGTYGNVGTSAIQPWTAASAGSETLTYQPVDSSGAAQGNPITFNIIVT